MAELTAGQLNRANRSRSRAREWHKPRQQKQQQDDPKRVEFLEQLKARRETRKAGLNDADHHQASRLPFYLDLSSIRALVKK